MAGVEGHYFMGKTPPVRDPTDPEYEGQKQVKMFGFTLQEKNMREWDAFFSLSVAQQAKMCVFLFSLSHSNKDADSNVFS